MKIGTHDTAQKVVVIAEIGNNHEGCFEEAVKMVQLAAEAGADAVKFQTMVPEKLVSEKDIQRIKQLRGFQFEYEQFASLKQEADRHGILFLSTPFDLQSVEFLSELVPAFKISSGDNTFWPLLEAVAKTHKPVILSTGLTTHEDLEEIQSRIYGWWGNSSLRSELAFLHCVTSYPTPDDEANLAAIKGLSAFGVVPGYSDHTQGVLAPVAAVALGARIIEKHFTDNKNKSSFRDHQLSADPEEFALMVKQIRQVEKMLGDGKRNPRKHELENKEKVRRSLVAGVEIIDGEVIEWRHLSWVRPGGGLPPGSEAMVLGKKARRRIEAGEMLRSGDLV